MDGLTDVRGVSAYTVAITSLAIWLLNTYVFKGHMPEQLQSTIAILIPAALTYLAAHVALYKPPPNQPGPIQPAKAVLSPEEVAALAAQLEQLLSHPAKVLPPVLAPVAPAPPAPTAEVPAPLGGVHEN